MTSHSNNSSCTKWLDIVSAMILVTAFGCHFHLAAATALDVPFWDDWNWFPKENLSWIYAFDNEHRCVPTRLLLFLQFASNGWDIRTGIMVNFILFGVTLLTYVRLLLFCAKQVPKWSVYLLSLCVLSPLAIEVHHWGIGSAWHFPMLFGIMAISQLFHPDVKISRDVAGALLLALCMYSVGAGLVFSFSTIIVWILYCIGLSTKDSNSQSLRKTLARLSPVVGIYLIAIVLWFNGYKKVPAHEVPAAPWTPQFWHFLGILLQNGFALPRRISLQAPWLGYLIILPYLVIPACYFMGRHIFSRRNISPEVAALVALNAGLLGVVAMTSYGRGNFPIGFTTSGRYLIFLLYLIPVSVLLWVSILTEWNKIHHFWLVVSCVFFLGLQINRMPSFARYRNNMVSRHEHLRMINDYYINDGPRPLYLPGFWVPVDKYLDEAKERNFSFYRKIQKDQHPAQ